MATPLIKVLVLAVLTWCLARLSYPATLSNPSIQSMNCIYYHSNFTNLQIDAGRCGHWLYWCHKIHWRTKHWSFSLQYIVHVYSTRRATKTTAKIKKAHITPASSMHSHINQPKYQFIAFRPLTPHNS